MKALITDKCTICKRKVVVVAQCDVGEISEPTAIVDRLDGKLLYFCSIGCHKIWKKAKEEEKK